MTQKTLSQTRAKITKYHGLINAHYTTRGIPEPMHNCIRLVCSTLAGIVAETAALLAVEDADAVAIGAEQVEFSYGQLKLKQKPSNWSGAQVDALWFLFSDHEKWG